MALARRVFSLTDVMCVISRPGPLRRPELIITITGPETRESDPAGTETKTLRVLLIPSLADAVKPSVSLLDVYLYVRDSTCLSLR